MAKKDAGGTNDKTRRDGNAKSKGGDGAKDVKDARSGDGKKDKKPKRPKPQTPKEYAIAFVRWLWPVIVMVVIVFALRSTLVDWNDVPSGSMQPTIVVGDRIFVNKLAYDLKAPFTLWRIARWDHPQRGDVVIWLHPTEGDWTGKTRLVKRVIGLPGDKIQLIDVSNNAATKGMSKLVITDKQGQKIDITYTPAEAPASTKGLFDPRKPYRYYTENLGGVEHLVAFVGIGSSEKDERGQPKLPAGIIRSFARDEPFEVPEGTYFLMGDNRDESRDSRYFDDIGYTIPEANILGRSSRVVFSLGDNWMPRGDRFFHAMP